MYFPEWLRTCSFISSKLQLQYYPPFHNLKCKVLTLSPDWKTIEISLPLNKHNSNPGGSMFGGAIALLADPIPALSCNSLFPGHSVWTRSMKLDFRKAAHTDLVLKFHFKEDLLNEIADDLDFRGRSTPNFIFGFYNQQNELCVQVDNTVAIRPENYEPLIKGIKNDNER